MTDFEERLWDADYQDVLFLEGTPEGLKLIVTSRDDAMSILLPPEQVRRLRLAVTRYERALGRGT